MIKSEHRWCMFLSIDNDKELTAKYIKSVTYTVHTSNKMVDETVTEPPFLLSRPDFGTFLMRCAVVLSDGDTFSLSHYLVFGEGGDAVKADVDIDGDVCGQLKEIFTRFNERGEQQEKRLYRG